MEKVCMTFPRLCSNCQEHDSWTRRGVFGLKIFPSFCFSFPYLSSCYFLNVNLQQPQYLVKGSFTVWLLPMWKWLLSLGIFWNLVSTRFVWWYLTQEVTASSSISHNIFEASTFLWVDWPKRYHSYYWKCVLYFKYINFQRFTWRFLIKE